MTHVLASAVLATSAAPALLELAPVDSDAAPISSASLEASPAANAAETQSRSSASGTSVTEDRHAALDALTVATRAFVAAARHVRARGPWSADDTMDVRRALKRAGRLRRSRAAAIGTGQTPPSVSAIWRCVCYLDEAADRFRARRSSRATPAPSVALVPVTHLAAAAMAVPPDTCVAADAAPSDDACDQPHRLQQHVTSPVATELCDATVPEPVSADVAPDVAPVPQSDEATSDVPTSTNETKESNWRAASLADVEVDSLTPAELAVFVARHRFVTLVEGGMRVMEAVEKAHLLGHRDAETNEDRLLSERGARNLLRRYRQHGASALLDRRLRSVVEGRNPRRVRTPQVEQVVLRVWTSGRQVDDNTNMPATAGLGAVTRVAQKECPAGGPIPSESTVRRIIAAEPYAVHCFRSGQEERWRKAGRSVVRADLGATRGNERGQFDHSPMDMWIRVDTDDHRDGALAVPTWITCALCSFTRTVMATIIEDVHPTAWTTALLLRKAILPKQHPQWLNHGIPYIYQPDRGSTLIANSLQISLAKLHATFDPDPPYYPNRKGKVERFFQTLDENCLTILPGHKSRGMVSQEAAQKRVHQLLSITDLRAEVDSWIVNDYHQWPHPRLRGSTREQVWQETALIRMPEESERDGLDVLLLKHDRQRVVQNVGIEFTFPERQALGGIYWAEELDDWKKRQVKLAYNPEDDASILVYEPLTNHLICEAWKDPDPARVKASRRAYEAGVRERLAAYAAERETVRVPPASMGLLPAAGADRAAAAGGDPGSDASCGVVRDLPLENAPACRDADVPSPQSPQPAGTPAGPSEPTRSDQTVAHTAEHSAGATAPQSPQRRPRVQARPIASGAAPRLAADSQVSDAENGDVIDLVERLRRITRGGT